MENFIAVDLDNDAEDSCEAATGLYYQVAIASSCQSDHEARVRGKMFDRTRFPATGIAPDAPDAHVDFIDRESKSSKAALHLQVRMTSMNHHQSQ